MTKKVLLGMSGGVDSSIAVKLLQDEGYDVLGATMKLTDDKIVKHNHLPESISDAKKVANAFNIDHMEVDFKDEFNRQIISYFVEAYEQGTTPNPCIVCNKQIKFGKFLDLAIDEGCDYVATGHYAKIEKDETTGRYLLKRAVDSKKDQTYFLYRLNQDALSRSLMPLGYYTKDQVREIGKEMKLEIAGKKDSEEICFVQHEDHGSFILRMNPDAAFPGNFVDEDGKVLGQHKGIIHYTVGQRRGLGIATGERIFVSNINPKRNEITVSDVDSIMKTKVIVKDINLIPFDSFEGEMEVTTKIRHSMIEYPAKIKMLDEDTIEIKFDSPVRGPAKGQSAVFYDGDIVVGGGFIVDYK